MQRPPGGVRKFVFLFFVIVSAHSQAQDNARELEELYNELDSIFANDELPGDLFRLADSIIALENAKISAVNVRAGYVSEVQSAGRAFAINQFGYTGSFNYFHYTGINAGITGYGNNGYEPAYYMTDLYLGYMYTWKQKLTLQLNQDFYIYNDSIGYHPFDKSLQLYVNHQFKYADAGIDYAFLYGNSEANRITAHFNGRIKFRFKKIIDAITIMPGCSFQWGNADIIFLRQPQVGLKDLQKIINDNDYPELARREYLKLTYLLESNRENAAKAFLKQRDYTPQQIEELFDFYYKGSVRTESAFGFLNWNLSLPVLIRKGKFSLLINYTYNIPQALTGETAVYPASGYFSTSLSYMVAWQRKTKAR